MKNIKLLVIFFSVLFLCFNIYSDDKPQKKIRVAVLNFSTKGDLNPNIADAVVENLITSLIDSGSFEVVERNQLNAVMQELKLQSSDDFNDNVRKQLGKLYGVEMVILGSVTQIGNYITINTRGIEVETGIAKFAKNLTTDSENNIPYLIPLLVDIISGKKIDVSAIDQNKILNIQNDNGNSTATNNESTPDAKKNGTVIDKKNANKILIAEIKSSSTENEAYSMDDVEGLDDYHFKQIAVEVEKNGIQINYFKIWFDDWDDDFTLDNDVELGKNNVNSTTFATTNKNGEERVVKKIKIKFEVLDITNEDAVVRIYGIK